MKGSEPVVLVSEAKAARDIFDKMGTITGSRQYQYLTLDVASNGFAMGFQPAGPEWRLARKLFHGILNVGATRQYLPYQELESTKLAYDLISDPTNWRQHIFRYSNCIGLLLTRGKRVRYSDNPDIQEVQDNFYRFAMIQQIPALVDYFPILRHIPDFLMPSVRHAREHCAQDAKIALKHYLPCKESTGKAVDLPSFNRSLNEKQAKENFPDIMGARMGLDLLTVCLPTCLSCTG